MLSYSHHKKEIKNLSYDGLFLYFTYTTNEVILLTKFILEYSQSVVPLPNFYRHYLVDQYAEELVNIDEQTYNYKIELFSEIKALEDSIIIEVSTEDKKSDSYRVFKGDSQK